VHSTKAKLGHVRILPVESIKPAPENDLIYHAISEEDPDIQGLAESIGKIGVLEPIVISKDNFVLSGHRRLFAAELIGLTEIPCRTEDISHNDLFFKHRLTEYNRQRVKGIDEVFREELLRADPNTSYDQLLSERIDRANIDLGRLSVIRLRDEKYRARDQQGEATDAGCDQRGSEPKPSLLAAYRPPGSLLSAERPSAEAR
jgi:hypothetical protein